MSDKAVVVSSLFRERGRARFERGGGEGGGVCTLHAINVVGTATV